MSRDTLDPRSLEQTLKDIARIQISPPSDPPPRVVEIEGAIFDLNDIVAILRAEDMGPYTEVYLRNMGGVPLSFSIEYERFKDLIGANPVKLEAPDEG